MKRPRTRPGCKYNGRTVIFQEADGFLILMPNGEIRYSLTATEALEWTRLHFAEQTPAGFMGIGQIEYRTLQEPTKGVQ